MMKSGGRRTARVVALSLFCAIFVQSAFALPARVVAFVPEQGDWQAAGSEMRSGYMLAQQRLEETSRSKVIIETQDCSLDSTILREMVLDLADSDCIGIIGGFPSSSAAIIAEAATLAGIPYLIDCAAADTLTRLSREYVFRLCPPLSSNNDGIVAWASEVAGRGRTAAIVCDTSTFQHSLEDLRSDLSERWDGKIEVLPFRKMNREFGDCLDRLEQLNPAIVWLFGSTAENGMILRQARERDWNPYAFIVGAPEMVNRRLISYTEGAADYTVGPVVWSPDLPGFGVADFVNHYRTRTGEYPGVRAAYSYVGLLVLADALQRAGIENRDSLRESLGRTAVSSIIGDVRFETFGGYSQQNRPVTYAAQVVGDSWKIVYPLEYATADDVYPVPRWRERAATSVVPSSRQRKLLALGIASLLTAALLASKGFSRRKRVEEREEE